MEFLQAQKFESEVVRLDDGECVVLDPPDPDLSLKGWTCESLLRRVRAWHARRRGGLPRRVIGWARCDVGEFAGEGSKGRAWTIRELLDSTALREEGEAMHHCVRAYVSACVRRSSAIWSLTVEEAGSRTRVATVEVEPAGRRIVQVKAQCNRAPGADCFQFLERWAEREGLTIDLRAED